MVSITEQTRKIFSSSSTSGSYPHMADKGRKGRGSCFTHGRPSPRSQPDLSSRFYGSLMATLLGLQRDLPSDLLSVLPSLTPWSIEALEVPLAPPFSWAVIHLC